MNKFGKFENNVFSFAPKMLKDAKFTYFNPTEEKYKEFGKGYKSLIFAGYIEV